METTTGSVEMTTNDMDIMKKMEDEHFRLQRQVRGIQADRINRSMGVHPQFRRQDQLLKVLKGEYLDVLLDLKIASTGAHKKKDKRMKIELRRALLLRNKTEQKHEGGLTMMSQLDHLLYRNSKYALSLKNQVTANTGQIKERRVQSEKGLVSTENRLETAMLRFNMVQYENKQIREEIEHMLKDRALFNQAWSKTLKILTKGKKFLTDLFESSTVAYDLRDEWCGKLRSMQEKGKVDQMLQIQEMRDLQKAFDHEMKLYTFLAQKGVRRVNIQQEMKEEEEIKKQQEQAQKELRAHNALLSDIIEYAGHEDVDKIIERFERQEQENFSMYELLTEYCAENVVRQNDLLQLKQVLYDRRDFNEIQETKREEHLAELRQKVEEQREKNDSLRAVVEEKEQLIQRCLEQIDEIFRMLGCSFEPFENLLGDKKPSSRWQLSLTLFLITDKIKEYLEVVYYTERATQKVLKGERKMLTSRLKKYLVRPTPPECWKATPINLIVPADPCPACVETRWLARVTEAPEEPLTAQMTADAIEELISDTAYVRSDRIHNLTDCRVPSSRLLQAARLIN